MIIAAVCIIILSYCVYSECLVFWGKESDPKNVTEYRSLAVVGSRVRANVHMHARLLASGPLVVQFFYNYKCTCITKC